MSENHLNHHSSSQKPTLIVVSTDAGRVYRVTYAGMTREHEQEWQARIFYEQMLDMWEIKSCYKTGDKKTLEEL